MYPALNAEPVAGSQGCVSDAQRKRGGMPPHALLGIYLGLISVAVGLHVDWIKHNSGFAAGEDALLGVGGAGAAVGDRGLPEEAGGRGRRQDLAERRQLAWIVEAGAMLLPLSRRISTEPNVKEA